MRKEHITFEQALRIWDLGLWKGRKDTKPMSSMVYLKPNVYDMEIYKKYEPTFFAVFDSDQIIGVNSGFRTNDDYYRSRGIWVDPAYRKQGVAQMLFEMLQEQAKAEKCTYLWSIPRKSALPAYQKFGFIKTSDFFDENMLFGPNCYVLKRIEK